MEDTDTSAIDQMTDKAKPEDKKPPEAVKVDVDDKKTPKETGGPKGLEPTRYGDWEKGGRCIDF